MDIQSVRLPDVGLEGRGAGMGRGGAPAEWGAFDGRLQPEMGERTGEPLLCCGPPSPSSRWLLFLYTRLHSRIPERR